MSGTGGSGAPRWSPYPVQDWSTLPPDPYAPQLPETFVDPAWAPPAPRRASWLPMLVIAVVLALLAGGLWAADSAANSAPTAAGRFLPADGAAVYTNRQTLRSTGTEHQVMVTESARMPGTAAFLSLDAMLGRQVFSALAGQTPSGHEFWRTTTTDTASVTAGQQTTSVFLVDGPVQLLTVSGPGIARTFTPGLIELPADVRDGSTWTSRGRAAELHYVATFAAKTAVAPAPNCLSVTGTITLTTASNQLAQAQSQTTTWCPGAGIVSRSFTVGELTVAEQPAAAPAPQQNVRLVADPSAWTTPAGWQPKTAAAMSIDPNFGVGPLGGVPGTTPPVMTTSGLLIRPSSADDLIALTPKTQQAWTSVWRMHPGGRIMSLAAFGDVLVVTTSQRRMIGYLDTGVRLWSRELSDVAFRAPVRVTRGEAAVVDAAGSLSVFDLITGAVRWRTSVGAEVVAAPVADERTVVIIDGSDTVHAYEADDGAQRWTQDLEATGGIVLGDQLLLHNAATLMSLSLTDGRYRWMVPTQGSVLDLQTFGDDVALATRLGTTMISADGRVLARRPSFLHLTTDGRTMIGWGGTQAEVLDRSFAVLATWDTPDQTNASSEVKVVADRNGVWRFGEDWTMTGWAGQP